MHVTVDVLGNGVEEVDLEDATYRDVLAEVDLSPNEATVLVDGRPVPADDPVAKSEVTVLRLVKGG